MGRNKIIPMEIDDSKIYMLKSTARNIPKKFRGKPLKIKSKFRIINTCFIQFLCKETQIFWLEHTKNLIHSGIPVNLLVEYVPEELALEI